MSKDSNPASVPTLDYRGERDERVWIMEEKVLKDAVKELTAERDFLREVLRKVLERP